jgi:NAD(P)-dependent dehydrogenase (short-subunit alcohol dehydrogenase family)
MDAQTQSQKVRPKAVVVGAGSGIAQALCLQLLELGNYQVHAISRDRPPNLPAAVVFHAVDYSEADLGSVAKAIAELPGTLERLIICNGVLHGDDFQPERALRQLHADTLLSVMNVNAVIPIMVLSAFAAQLHTASAPRVAALSARVGSIGDNRLGGWYSYRASKAALNMLLRSAAIELHRSNKSAKLIAFHPGTTDTPMSKPFQRGVPSDKLFTPVFVADQLLSILDDITADGELSFVDWAGKTIDW